MEGRPIFRNQRRVARVAIGLFAFFFGFVAWQGIHYDEFWGRHATIRRKEDPERYWTLFSFYAGGSAGAAIVCMTWNRRAIAQRYPEE